MQNRNWKIILGLLISNVTALALMIGTRLLMNYAQGEPYDSSVKSASNILIGSDFFIIPLLMGFLSALAWRDLELKGIKYLIFSLYNSLIGLSFSWAFMGEGYICLLIVSPLVVGLVIAGAYIGRAVFRRKNRTLNYSVFGILLSILTIDSLSTHDFTNMVSDTIIINAPREKVWQYVAEYEPNTSENKYWLFQIGMPSPVQSTVTDHKEGAGRKCIFSNGYVFDEVMTVYKPNEDLTFKITDQPRDPEIMGHIDILKGQFLLKDNGNGTTTLIGNSWYKLYVFPAWYYDIWAKSITRNVHLRVMEHIKMLSEK